MQNKFNEDNLILNNLHQVKLWRFYPILAQRPKSFHLNIYGTIIGETTFLCTRSQMIYEHYKRKKDVIWLARLHPTMLNHIPWMKHALIIALQLCTSLASEPLPWPRKSLHKDTHHQSLAAISSNGLPVWNYDQS